MPNPERPAGEPTPKDAFKPEEGFAIIVTPSEKDGVVFSKLEDGRPQMTFRGEVSIFPTKETLPDWLLTPSNEQSSSETPNKPETPHSGQYSEQETVFRKLSPSEQPQTPEQENQRFDLQGNVVYAPSYKVRRSGKRIADFAIATHPSEETTEYWRIRAFDKQADKVRDQVQKGQQIEASVYGPKRWTVHAKAKDGTWEEKEVQGYYLGFAKIPQRNREQQETQQTTGDTPSS